MIKVNLKKAVSEKGIDRYSSKVEVIHDRMERFLSDGNDFLGWMHWPSNPNLGADVARMKKIAKRLKKEGVEVLVVIGIGGSFLGAKSGIDMINGLYDETHIKVIFAGTSLSAMDLGQQLAMVAHKKFAINVISKSGTTTEPAIAFRLFKKLLEKREGKAEASRLIFATTDGNRGALLKMAKTSGWDTFVIPDDIGGRYSVLTAVGLLPMAIAGIDIEVMLEGAREAEKDLTNGNLAENPAYQYAVARDILGKSFPAEMYVTYEPCFEMFLEWLKQLFGESEGKMGKGILPTSAVFTRDLHSLGQFIQEGSKVMFETVLNVENPTTDIQLFHTTDDLDGLNYLVDKSLNEINLVAQQGTTHAHAMVGKVPNIRLDLFENEPREIGYMFYFFMRAAAMSAYLLKINPFNQPGVEVYKSNMFRLLGKPIK